MYFGLKFADLDFSLYLCPIFAFLFGAGSKFATDDAKKFSLFVVYAIALYIVALSMFMQWSNELL